MIVEEVPHQARRCAGRLATAVHGLHAFEWLVAWIQHFQSGRARGQCDSPEDHCFAQGVTESGARPEVPGQTLGLSLAGQFIGPLLDCRRKICSPASPVDPGLGSGVGEVRRGLDLRDAIVKFQGAPLDSRR